jgi:hypothetical protein
VSDALSISFGDACDHAKLRFVAFNFNLFRDPYVILPSASVLRIPSIRVDHQKMALYRLEWEQFLSMPLPLDDDDDSALFNREKIGLHRIGRADAPAPLSFSHKKNLKFSAAPSPEAFSVDASPSLGAQMLVAGSLISNREQHACEIQLGHLKKIKNILAESVAAMRREELLTIKYEAGDTMNGYGIRVFPDGTIYAGDFLGGQRDGLGVLRWSNGHSYFGSWFEDLAHGRGRYRFPNGDIFTGEWDNGCEVGEGSFTHDDGEVFDGENPIAHNEFVYSAQRLTIV